MAKDTQKDTTGSAEQTAKSKTVHPYTEGTIQEFGFFGNTMRIVLKGTDSEGKDQKYMVSLRITQVVPPEDFETIYQALNNA